MGCTNIQTKRSTEKKSVITIKHNQPLAHSEPLLKDLGLLNLMCLPHNNTDVLLQARS